jgi:hypothetical protein
MTNGEPCVRKPIVLRNGAAIGSGTTIELSNLRRVSARFQPLRCRQIIDITSSTSKAAPDDETSATMLASKPEVAEHARLQPGDSAIEVGRACGRAASELVVGRSFDGVDARK